MPYPYYSNSISSFNTIPIPEEPYYYSYNQAHSFVSQAPHAITFCTASPTTLPMTDHHNNHSIDIRDLDARLTRVEQLQHHHHQQEEGEEVSSTTHETTTTNNGDAQRRSRSPLDISFLPRFTKSSTMSTTSTGTSSASATTRLHPESVGLAPGTFSKPRVPRRSRRDTFSSSGSTTTRGARARSEDGHQQQQQQEFRYYGRHGNQWLFNDFSVTGAVARGVRRVFSGNNGGKDWYEERK